MYYYNKSLLICMIDIETKVKGIIFSDETNYFPYLIKIFRKNNIYNVAVFL